jgi:hypothetical protein
MYGRPLVQTTVETKRRHFGDRMNETREEWLKRRRREEREKSGK